LLKNARILNAVGGGIALSRKGLTLYRLTKELKHKPTKLYRFPKAQTDSTVTLEFITSLDLSRETVELGGRVTAADISPDGKVLAVLTY